MLNIVLFFSQKPGIIQIFFEEGMKITSDGQISFLCMFSKGIHWAGVWTTLQKEKILLALLYEVLFMFIAVINFMSINYILEILSVQCY